MDATLSTVVPSRFPVSRAEIGRSIPERFDAVVRRFPDLVALTGDGRSWTYRDLHRDVNRIAGAIQARTAVGRGCVASLLPLSPEMVIAALAIQRAGKAFLALHPMLPRSAQEEILADAAPDLFVTGGSLSARARELTGV